MKILVVEDDEGAADFIAAGLNARGHEATVARDGREGFERASADRFDAIVLDRMLPELDGLGVVALMRAEGVSTPVLFLTNLSGIDDRVDGLEAGGDDYLVKPFAFEELMARLTALARRPTLGSSPTDASGSPGCWRRADRPAAPSPMASKARTASSSQAISAPRQQARPGRRAAGSRRKRTTATSRGKPSVKSFGRW